MRKKSLSLVLAAVLLTLAVPVYAIAAETETLLYGCTFDDEASQGESFEIGTSVTGEWVNRPGAGYQDDTSFMLTHIDGETYNSSANILVLNLPEPLQAGGVYRIVARVYAASAENPGKGTLTGPGFVLNADYAGAQGEVKFPTDFGTLPMDEWKTIDVTMPMQEAPVTRLDFRLVINDADKHPDVWYWDDIQIYQVGEVETIEVPEWDVELASLYQVYQDYFLLGNILEPNQLLDPQTETMFKNYYNAMTAANAMKPTSISREKDVYSFTGADQLVSWAQENGIAIHGHTLLWHDQSPDWLYKNAEGGPLTRAEAKANLESYVTEVAGHFAGKLISWDVVNEAFTPSVADTLPDWRDGLRTDVPWYQAYANGADTANGEHAADYIYDAFVFARLADPNAILYYLDYNEEYAGKREAMARMTEDLNKKWKDDPRNTEPDRLLIEGLGLQAHYWTSALNPADVEKTIQRFMQTGARLSISELDIPFGSYGTYQQRTEAPTEDELAYQAKLYGELFKIFIRYTDAIDRVTLWGLADPQSWRSAGYPTLFDKSYSPKPAFDAVMQVVNPVSEPEPEQPMPSQTEPSAAAPETPSPSPAGDEEESGFPWGYLIIGFVVLAAVGAIIIVLSKKK